MPEWQLLWITGQAVSVVFHWNMLVSNQQITVQTRREMAEHNLNHVFSSAVPCHDEPFLSSFMDKGLHLGPIEIQGSLVTDFSGTNHYRPGRVIGGCKCS